MTMIEYLNVLQASLPVAAFPSSASLIPEPLGVVLIISTWNFPIGTQYPFNFNIFT